MSTTQGDPAAREPLGAGGPDGSALDGSGLGAGPDGGSADWHARVVRRSLRTATQRSIDRGTVLVQAAARLLERTHGDRFTVQDVADEAGQSLRTLYQYFESKDDLLLAVFEEAMRTYAAGIAAAIADLDDPLERLAGGMLATLRMPERSGTAVDQGLARLRLQLSEVRPELVARSQLPVTRCLHALVADAMAAGVIRTDDVDGATYVLVALKSAVLTGRTLGNDTGVGLPDLDAVVTFCLAGLGASRHGAPIDRGWLDAVDARLRLPDRLVIAGPGRPR